MIKFDELNVGDKFIVKGFNTTGESYTWTGMKCVDLNGESYIVDLSDIVGFIVSDVDEYEILERA